MLTHEQKRKWLERLRDPSSVQLRGGYTRDYSKPSDPMCCLAHGQLAITGNIDIPYNEHGKFDIMSEMEAIDVKDQLVKMNDVEKMSLPEIADWIEANVPSCAG